VVDGFFVIGIFVSVVITLIFVIEKATREGPNATLEEGLTVLVRSYSLVVCIKICFFVTFDPGLNLATTDRLYIFIGGFVIFWTSLGAIVDKFRGK
jgi:ABC-type arginine transport system permease subunit